MSAQQLIPIQDRSQVGNARRVASQLAASLQFDETRVGQVALVVTEAATNIIKHAGHGCVLLRATNVRATPTIEVLALDRGRGIKNISASLRDGHSTAGSLGSGLGALQRLSDTFDIYTQPDQGTVLRLELLARRTPPAATSFEMGSVTVAKSGETVSGDAWAIECTKRHLTVLMADGLGHGPEAARAAQAAVRALHAHADYPLPDLLDVCHRDLRATRGAAVAMARLDPYNQSGQFAAVGNIVARVEDHSSRRSLVSHNGIVGHTLRKVQQFDFAWPRDALLVMHSDGLGTQWDLSNYPGLLSKHPSLIAGVLYRDYDRGRDDATVVVIRNTVVQ